MNHKRNAVLVIALSSSILGATHGPAVIARLIPFVEYEGHGSSVEPAATVAEETARAELVVLARVVSRENRILRAVLPVYAEDAVTVLEERTVETPFTDVTFEVLETIKGSSASRITVLQTGGVVTDGTTGRDRRFHVVGDPLFEEGSEHFLFLVDITGDGVHSTGRQLYRTVNEMGRYQLGWRGSLRGPDRLRRIDPALASRLPRTEKELRAQIAQALATAK